MAIGARADQIITGTAITLGAVGLTGTIYRQAYGTGGAGLDLPTLAPIADPGALADPAPRARRSSTSRRRPTSRLLALPLVWWVLFRTRAGLALRATGEAAAMARAAGVRTRLVRTVATIVGGGFAGLAGATLVLAQVGTFAERMTAGRGYVAIAIVVLGRWHPAGVALAALLFGAATALQYLFQALGLDVPYQLFLMLPYVLTLLALAGAVGRVRAPADLGARCLVDAGLALQPAHVRHDARRPPCLCPSTGGMCAVAPVVRPHPEPGGALERDVGVVVRLVVRCAPAAGRPRCPARAAVASGAILVEEPLAVGKLGRHRSRIEPRPAGRARMQASSSRSSARRSRRDVLTAARRRARRAPRRSCAAPAP